MTTVTNHRTVAATITIHRLNSQELKVGQTEILVSKGTLESVSFYSTLHLPVHEGIELLLVLDQQSIAIRPIQTGRLDDGWMK